MMANSATAQPLRVHLSGFKKIKDVEFQPGEVELDPDPDGRNKISDQSGARLDVSGWRIIKLNGIDFSHDYFEALESCSENYTATCQAPQEKVKRFQDKRGNLHIQEEDIVARDFELQGCKVKDIRVVPDARTGRVRFGFIEFEDESSFRIALELSERHEIGGLHVKVADKPAPSGFEWRPVDWRDMMKGIGFFCGSAAVCVRNGCGKPSWNSQRGYPCGQDCWDQLMSDAIARDATATAREAAKPIRVSITPTAHSQDQVMAGGVKTAWPRSAKKNSKAQGVQPTGDSQPGYPYGNAGVAPAYAFFPDTAAFVSPMGFPCAPVPPMFYDVYANYVPAPGLTPITCRGSAQENPIGFFEDARSPPMFRASFKLEDGEDTPDTQSTSAMSEESSRKVDDTNTSTSRSDEDDDTMKQSGLFDSSDGLIVTEKKHIHCRC